jgi:hypothetical protein
VYTVFTPYTPSHTLSPPFLPLTVTPLLLGRTCFALLFSDFVKEKKMTFFLV